MEKINLQQALVDLRGSGIVSYQTHVLSNKGSHYEAPYYLKPVITKDAISKAVLVLQTAKPNITDKFLTILIDRIAEAGFSEEELKDAILYVIDNNPYPTIDIADIVSQKPKIKYYTYRQYGKLCDAEGVEYIKQRYLRVDVRDRYDELLFASIEDIERFEIPLSNSKNKLS